MKFDDYLQEQLKDPEFKKEWDAIQPEMNTIRAEIEVKQTMKKYTDFDEMYNDPDYFSDEDRKSIEAEANSIMKDKDVK